MQNLAQPLLFERLPYRRVWGGTALEELFGIEVPERARPLGETWELVDRDDSNSQVRCGDLAGHSLRELMGAGQRELLGKVEPARDGRFPLLVKYLDAEQNLSVQVHPTDEVAAELGQGAEGKTEAWYVLEARPGACVWSGLRPEVHSEEFGAAVRAGEPRLVEMLLRWEVRPGQCLIVPGGTVHAIGAGVTVLEVQQNSDTTYRLYDWGRLGLDGKPREVHVEQGLRATSFGAPARGPIDPVYEEVGENLRRAFLARSRQFGVNELRLSGPVRLSGGGQFQIYAAVSGAGRLSAGEGTEVLELATGDVALVPAAAGYHTIEPADGELTLVQLLARP